MSKKILITTAIAYPNATPHMGFASEAVVADFLSRAFRKTGYEVFFSTGTDENSLKIVKAAKTKGISTQDFVDKTVETFKHVMNIMEVEYDRFIRTTDNDHINAVKHFWKEVSANGLIYKGVYRGFFSPSEETFFSEDELINGKSPLGNEVFLEETPAYFFKSSELRTTLNNFLESRPNLTVPTNRINELKGFFAKDLYDLCISRKNEGWGISVPEDEHFVIYVWFDALINYLTVCGYPNINQFWDGRVIHVVGKDISIFHGVHWPAMLLGHNNIKLFDTLLVRNWWLLDGEKMSKSKGNVVDPVEMVQKFGLAPFRFYCIKDNLIKADSSIDNEKLVDYFNTFVVGKFSNLVFRLWTILHRNGLSCREQRANESFEEKIKKNLETLDINGYLDTIFEWCDYLNREIDQKQAWKTPELCNHLFEEVLRLAGFFDPIFPGTQQKILSNPSPVMLFQKIL